MQLLIITGLVLNCAVFGTLFRPLKPINLALTQQGVDVVELDDQKKSSADQLPLLFRIKKDRDDHMRKWDSLGSFADNASVTAEPKPGPRSRFLKTNNNKYPTAAQVLVRSTTSLSGPRRPSVHSLNAQTNSLHGSNTSTASPPKSQKRLSGSSYTDVFQQEEGKPVLAVNAVPEDVTLKREATCNEILKPVEEERRGSDETTEILGETDRTMIMQAANKASKRTRTTSESSSKFRDAGVRPLYRDDIFFGASLQKLPQYTSQVKEQAGEQGAGMFRNSLQMVLKGKSSIHHHRRRHHHHHHYHHHVVCLTKGLLPLRSELSSECDLVLPP